MTDLTAVPLAATQGESQRRRRKSRRRRVAGVLLILLVLLAADYVIYPLLPIGGRSFNRGENGSWLRDSWYRGTERETVPVMAARLKAQGVRYAYFHVRFIKRDGHLQFRDVEPARRLLRALHRDAPHIKAVAWVYIGNERGLTGVDIANPSVRRAIVGEARWLTQTCGFDGVQWDYEICSDGDANLLKLLSETRRALPHGKLLSVATPMWLPSPLEKWGWSEAYFAQVAARCDQLAVMAYDSGLYLPRAYVWLVGQQVIRVGRAAGRGNPNCRVLIGVPTYEDGGLSHHRHAENLRMALKGVRAGLAGAADRRNFAGIALFADYSTDAEEAGDLRALWGRQG